MEAANIKIISRERKLTGKTADVYSFLELFIAKRERQIREIEQFVSRYEKKLHTEERARQNFSGLRKLFSGKKPDHHLAIEYIHYVKKPMEQAKQLREEIETAREMMANADRQQIIDLMEAAEG